MTQDHTHTSWSELNKAGTYVEETTGELYSIPFEGIKMGSGPQINRYSNKSSQFVQVSTDPNLDLDEARRLVEKLGIRPDF